MHDVDNHKTTTRAQYPRGLLDGMLPPLGGPDVVDRQAGQHDIEGGVGEFQRSHVPGVQLDAARDTPEVGVSFSGLGGVSGRVALWRSGAHCGSTAAATKLNTDRR